MSQPATDHEVLLEIQLFGLLLKGFEAFDPMNKASIRPEEFASLLSGYMDAVEVDRQEQENTAADFNLLDVLGITGNENRHSMALAWLLDRDHAKNGTHGQGNLGFRLLLEELKLPLSYAQGDYYVKREVAGEESRVDVEIALRGSFLIHIENKIWAKEGLMQTDREWDDLVRRAKMLSIDPTDANVHALFLTPAGNPPLNESFRAISWRQIALVLDSFAKSAKPLDVRLFAAHYADALRRFVIEKQYEGEQ